MVELYMNREIRMMTKTYLNDKATEMNRTELNLLSTLRKMNWNKMNWSASSFALVQSVQRNWNERNCRDIFQFSSVQFSSVLSLRTRLYSAAKISFALRSSCDFLKRGHVCQNNLNAYKSCRCHNVTRCIPSRLSYVACAPECRPIQELNA